MPDWLRHQLLIVAVATPVLFFRLGDARLWDRDEPRNARCAVEMLQRNDWIVPYFNAELRTHKPVLTYWLMMSSYAVFGVNEFAARFWSAALGLGTVLCTYQLGSRLFNRGAGVWAALSLAPALMFDVASRAATPDAPLIFFVTAALTMYVRFAFPEPDKNSVAEPRFPRIPWQAACVWALVAVAVLAKGPVGLVLPLGIMGLSLLVVRVRPEPNSLSLGGVRLILSRCLTSSMRIAGEMRPGVALLLLLLIAVPWYVCVGYRTDGEFLRGFFWEHNVRRATETMEGHRGPALIFYPVTLLVGFFPASVFLIPALLEMWLRLRRQDRQSAGLAFCLVWIVAVVALFSLAKTKLPSYVTPCYPALAVLTGSLLQRWTSRELLISTRWLQVSLAALGVAACFLVPGIYALTQRKLPGEEWLAVLPVVLLVGGGLATYLYRQREHATEAAQVALGSGLLFSMLLMGWGAKAADRHQQSHLLVQAVEGDGIEEVAALHCLEPSWVFYSSRPILELDDPAQVADFLNLPHNRVILRSSDYDDLAANLPPGVEPLASASQFLKDDTLMVLGQGSQRAAASPDRRRR